MINSCLICFCRLRWRGGPFLCPSCAQTWEALRYLGLESYSCFLYRDAVRRLILDVKAKSLLRPMIFLGRVFCQDARVIESAARADAIMPVPNSLWSRRKGRLDLAHHLAWELAKASGKPFMAAPYSLGWHVRKQAFRRRDQRGNNLRSRSWGRYELNRSILLVDDVVTTGSTLNRISQQIVAKDISWITFATSLGNDAPTKPSY